MADGYVITSFRIFENSYFFKKHSSIYKRTLYNIKYKETPNRIWTKYVDG